MIKLGQRVRDRITGFEGIVIGRTEWLHGCVRITIQSQELKDGKPVDAQSFDEPQVEIIEENSIFEQKPAGGPTIEPQRKKDIIR